MYAKSPYQDKNRDREREGRSREVLKRKTVFLFMSDTCLVYYIYAGSDVMHCYIDTNLYAEKVCQDFSNMSQ